MVTAGIIGDLRNDPKCNFTATIQKLMAVVQGDSARAGADGLRRPYFIR
jgi:hypothetical protein